MVSLMNDRLGEDLAEMEKKLSLYVDKGRVTSVAEVREEPIIAVKPDKSLIKPLKKVSSFSEHFFAVDCSTRTLKRANNWGVYLLRVVFAVVKEREVDWSYNERICTVVGDSYTRYRFLGDIRVELESEVALEVVRRRNVYDGDYLLLDGPSYFGGTRKFRISLYEKCEEKGIRLLAVSKQSPMLHDERGRDFMATACVLSPYSLWVYYPVTTANKDKHLYGDVSIAKLCESSPRVFRCDIMEYLNARGIEEILSPLTSISEDPRCLGYPVTLWLAHDFSAPSDAKLLHYCEQVEKTLGDAGLLEGLLREELSCSFADELHGVRYPFQRELWGDYV